MIKKKNYTSKISFQQKCLIASICFLFLNNSFSVLSALLKTGGVQYTKATFHDTAEW